MFGLVLNERLRGQLEILSNKDGGGDLDASLALQQGWISFQSLERLNRQYFTARDDFSGGECMQGLRFRVEPRRKKGGRYTEEFRRQLEELRVLEQEREYWRLIGKDEEDYNKGRDSLLQINKQIKEQIAAVFNILLTVFGVTYGVWYVSGTSVVLDLHVRVLLCLFAGIVVLIADVAMYNMYGRKIEEAREVERTIKEEKRVITELII
ncbi:Vph2p Ecym_2467 [Eremothecium cymbalariae DBVPG|uniref:Vacuolar ATPase assembly integral membrane protein VPH2 n=1 Tax=Eremothecium cymbalariae (strain CBS 270.75 / DBVPG 7215 / KCTC 17166 / NRRL Y-17582) TaxID=931890 RepID=G8JPT5_ERECY|nr:Hypothetical protein Ecym_2467 [Eremothecium cymbalariae DBVPG\